MKNASKILSIIACVIGIIGTLLGGAVKSAAAQVGGDLAVADRASDSVAAIMLALFGSCVKVTVMEPCHF